MTQETTCFTNVFPHLYGDDAGTTAILAMDYDYSGNLLIGGYSTDPNLITGSQNGILAYLNNVGNVLWMS